MDRRTVPYVAWGKIHYCFTQKIFFFKNKTDLTGTWKNRENDKTCKATNEKRRLRSAKHK
jgi:hypothetical protein